ncbi:ABC transporter ATP-binding protein [Pseudomonas sp. K2I15]|uniref:ABC transporter ATP-binding protein n=1 Tax=unclassified Pseudomonas TaxID=196821 RepID=UPI000B4D720B|nr:ABC transporter ATP-binding protein [Pseudomonas sp. K2I15]OWP69555.1 sugar ABC transporter ATP-binding protein [Pseudomonas sp. K2I15]
MAHITFDNVTIRYPIYNGAAKSLKKTLVNVGTGGFLSKEPGDVLTITALDKVSFKLSDGDAIGLIGHNGAGKTTLLRTMAGIYPPSSGLVTTDGRISTIIELGAGLDSELSGYENIFRLGLLLGMSKVQVQKLIPVIEEFTELGNFLQAPVRTYSSGMLMRLMFAVSTSNQPEILLVDEMFGTGDKGFQEKAKARMEGIISSAKIFVFASHSEELISKFCNRVFELKHGTVTEVT